MIRTCLTLKPGSLSLSFCSSGQEVGADPVRQQEGKVEGVQAGQARLASGHDGIWDPWGIVSAFLW